MKIREDLASEANVEIKTFSWDQLKELKDR